MNYSEQYNREEESWQKDTIQAYKTFAHKFAETRSGKKAWSEFEYLLPKLQGEPLHILDIGSGSGRMLPYLKEHGKIASYTGIDGTRELVDEAKKRHSPTFGEEFVCVSMLDFVYPKEQYDLVILIASFHHLLEKDAQRVLLEKVYSSLKTGGTIFMTNWKLTDNAPYAHCRVRNTPIFAVPLSDGKKESLLRYYYSFEEKELTTLIERVGFECELQCIPEGSHNIVTIGRKS